jgi:hypothetical protein
LGGSEKKIRRIAKGNAHRELLPIENAEEIFFDALHCSFPYRVFFVARSKCRSVLKSHVCCLRSPHVSVRRAGPLLHARRRDWADRFPAIVEGAARVQAPSFLILGEAVIARDDGTPEAICARKGLS